MRRNLGRCDPALLEMGMRMPRWQWLDLNGNLIFRDPSLEKYVAPFPPPRLMHNVSGTISRFKFAIHGVVLFDALETALGQPLARLGTLLDFGCGSGRLARMFKGHPGRVIGCDIDPRHTNWINDALPFMSAVTTEPLQPLPFADGTFDGVISISVFTHLNEACQDFYLAELARCVAPGGTLLLTIHGHRALERALHEKRIFDMLSIGQDALARVEQQFEDSQHSFIIQQYGHLTTDTYPYGISFIPHAYIRHRWGEFFEIAAIRGGAIQDFQDIVVCRRR
ncbi:MAG TPA: class I SAM-dependent methyltransferase [Dongiaceae bacterium]|nr:class I SAM-dependent methyltransferase [Dongiaceae bacterium]